MATLQESHSAMTEEKGTPSLGTPSGTTDAEPEVLLSTATAPDQPHIEPPPDGGLRAWLTVAGSFMASFAQFGLTNSYGVFQEYYETNTLKTYSPDTISWIGGVQTFILFFGGILAGRAFDAYGAHAVLIPGSIGFVLSLMFTSRAYWAGSKLSSINSISPRSSSPLTAVCKEYYQLMLAQGILFGMSSALIFTPVMSIASQWFARRRALATAIAVTGSGLGGTLWPIAIRRMIDEIGFEWTLRASGFIALFCFIIANLLIRTRLPRKKPAPYLTLLNPFKEKAYALFACGMALSAWGWFTPFFFLPSRAAHLGATATLAAYTIAFLNAGSTVGRLVAGVGDKLGRYNLVVLSTFLMGVLMLAMWIPLRSVDALIAFGVIYGFLVGVVISLIPPCIAQTSPMHEIGQRVGTIYAFISVFVLTGPPVNGAFLNHYPGDNGYTWSGLFSGVVIVVGSLSLFASRLCVSRKLWEAV